MWRKVGKLTSTFPHPQTPHLDPGSEKKEEQPPEYRAQNSQVPLSPSWCLCSALVRSCRTRQHRREAMPPQHKGPAQGKPAGHPHRPATSPPLQASLNFTHQSHLRRQACSPLLPRNINLRKSTPLLREVKWYPLETVLKSGKGATSRKFIKRVSETFTKYVDNSIEIAEHEMEQPQWKRNISPWREMAGKSALK